MNCPYLKGRNIKQCKAVSCTVVLSGCELAGFCETGDYEHCPVYRANQKRKGNAISLHDYCQIYSAWARSGGMERADKIA